MAFLTECICLLLISRIVMLGDSLINFILSNTTRTRRLERLTLEEFFFWVWCAWSLWERNFIATLTSYPPKIYTRPSTFLLEKFQAYIATLDFNASYLLLLFLLLLFIYFQKSIPNSSSEHTKNLFLFSGSTD